MSSSSKNEDQDAWIFDSLIGFLIGPVWNVPILTFIEHKSLIFEPDNDDHEDEYKKTQDEYKNLVDFMLNSYMEDIGISTKQFETACNSASSKIKSDFHHSLFEQVWAADDYEIFKRMMIQKNIELQLQALELLQHKYGVLPESLQPKKDQLDSENKVMQAVAKKSMEDEKSDNEEIGEAIAKSSVDKSRLVAEKNNQQLLLAEHFKKKVSIADPSVVIGSMENVSSSESSTQELDPAEMERRKNFLRAQRDKLLAMKKEEREKQLHEAEKQNVKSRPKSARAARSALGGRTSGASGLDPKTLEVRKALAEKLKQEVIGKH